MKSLISAKRGVIAAIAALGVLGASYASADIVQEGNIRISYNGNIAPSKLPRDAMAPVGVQMGAKIKTVDGEKPPRLSTITLDINSHGEIFAKGLATCAFNKLRNATVSGAKKA